MREIQPEPHEFSFPDGEFDEVFIRDASVHIERMDEKCYWLGIYGKDRDPLLLFTGVDNEGVWYFNINVDTLADDREHFISTTRPRKCKVSRAIPIVQEKLLKAEATVRELREALKLRDRALEVQAKRIGGVAWQKRVQCWLEDAGESLKPVDASEARRALGQ